MAVVRIVENEKEYQDALRVREIVFINEQKVPKEIEIDELENEATHFVVYDEDGKTPIGAGRFREVDEKGKVERICVTQSARGKHVGQQLMLKIENLAQKRGLKALVLNSQTHAIPFYEKLGYQITSDLFMDAGIPHKSMKKEIK